MLRLVATDLDGTVLRSDGSVSGRTAAEHTPMTRDVVLAVAAAVRTAVPDVAFAIETRECRLRPGGVVSGRT